MTLEALADELDTNRAAITAEFDEMETDMNGLVPVNSDQSERKARVLAAIARARLLLAEAS